MTVAEVFNRNPELLVVGNLVRTNFVRGEEEIIRVVTTMWKDSTFPSGVCVSVSGGLPCPSCGHFKGTPISDVDGSFFIPVRN